MSRNKQAGNAFRRRPPGVKYSRRWGFQLEGLLRAAEQARRGFAERLLAGVLLAVAVAGAVLIPRLLVGPTPGHELGVGAPSMTVPPVVLAPGLPGHKAKSPVAAPAQRRATHVGVVPSASTTQPTAQTNPVTSSGTSGHPSRTQSQPQAQPPRESQLQQQTPALPPTPLAAGMTTCNGTYGGTGKDLVVPGGATCGLARGAPITHGLPVYPGGRP